MTEQLLVYVHHRLDGEAHCEVVPDVDEGEEAPVYVVDVMDNEPDDVFGPIIQRAIEEAGYDFYVEHWIEEGRLESPAFRVPVPDGVTRTLYDLNKETG